MRTWREIEIAALRSPIIHAALTHHMRNGITREQALINAVLALDEANKTQYNQLIRHIENCTCRVMLKPDEASALPKSAQTRNDE